MLKLSEKEVAVLRAVELQADCSPAEIRKRTGFRDHTIRYSLKRLTEEGVIRKKPFINVYMLGYTDYAIYFSVASKTEEQVRRLLKTLKDSPQISSFARVGGDWQYRMSICAREHTEVVQFLDMIAERFPRVFFEKAVSLRVSLTLFERAYLSGRKSSGKTVRFGSSKEIVDLDARDWLILSGLENKEYTSIRHLGRLLNIPIATLDARIKRLEEEKVIAGWLYQVNCSKYGMQLYSMLIFAKGLGVDLRRKLFKFAKRHPHITYFLECLGSWDYELGLEVSGGEQVARVTQELYNAFGEDINTIKAMPIFSHLKLSNFPFSKKT